MKINRYSGDLPKAERSLNIFEGCLWRAKSPDAPFSEANQPKVIRENYCLTHGEINTVADLKATIRAGKYAWPGGYPMYFITSDGASLSFDAVEQEFSQVAYAVRHKVNDGWRVVGCEINFEDNLVCAHTGEPIESACGDD